MDAHSTPDRRTPGAKLLIAVLLAAMLTIPLFAVYLLVWDRQSQSDTARQSIAAGWGGPQRLTGPVLVIPYSVPTTETVTQNGRPVQHVTTMARELTIAPDAADLTTAVKPDVRRHSIYTAVVYAATTKGSARFSLPGDLARLGVPDGALDLGHAELRFGLSDPRGLIGAPPLVMLGGRRIAAQPGKGAGEAGGGFFAPVDASALRAGPLAAGFRYDFRGNGSLSLAPRAGDTRWRVTSPWASPGFTGEFLPTARQVGPKGFAAEWRVGNIALGRTLVATDLAQADRAGAPPATADAPASIEARVDLVSPVDLYAQVNRSVKYGFLFIGFTFAAFLLWDVIGGVRVATPEYLLVGAGLILFFVMLLAFAEVIGFTPAYLLASTAMVGLLAAYSAAVLGSWRRGGAIAALLAALYGVLYILISLEALSLIIGSVLLFAALAGVMYATRRLDWSGARG